MASSEALDVIIVGAGLSGVGAACHLQQQCPGTRYTILEARDAMGGTWDLFRYPGIRSDSDMHTLGYSFRPWRESKAIADGPAILQYIRETAAEYGIDRHIRYGHAVRRASWSSDTALWTVEAEDASGATVRLRCGLLLMCAGYFSYAGGHDPVFPGRERYRGPVVHPQDWSRDIDYRDKKVVIVGSGATAMTLVPAMAADAAHVTMLQRSPTYVISRPDRDLLANFMRRILPERVAYGLTRWKNIALQQWLYRQTRVRPRTVRRNLLKRVRRALGPDYDVDQHFSPRYDPWDQRLCLVPNGDLFEVIRAGKASVVTDTIDTFTESGIRLESGRELEADIVVTATGLQLVSLGGVDFDVDGQAVDFSTRYSYKGIMYSDVPNLVSTFGYINASWTLRSDLVARFCCRVIKHMAVTGSRQCTPRLRETDSTMPARPWIEGFTSGYMQRFMDQLPKQGDCSPWLNTQDYRQDRKLMLEDPVDDGVLRFTGPASAAPGPGPVTRRSDAA